MTMGGHEDLSIGTAELSGTLSAGLAPSQPQEKTMPFEKSTEAENGQSEVDNDSLTFNRLMVLISMAFLWTASQIPLYFYGGLEPRVLEDIGGYDESVWIALGILLPLAIVTPLVGNLADIFGRKSMGIIAFVLIIIGDVISTLAKSINVFIIGAVFMGVGSGVGELIALAVAGEIAPPRKRGFYVFGIVLSIVPFCPSVVYGQYVAYASTWRWVGLLIGAWCFVGAVLTAIFYQPSASPTTSTLHPGLSKAELAGRIDFIGISLSAIGLTLFLLGLSFATGSYSWTDTIVLTPFFIGIVLIVLFVVWEARYVKYPMFPARLKQHPRILTVLLVITFVSGANFFCVLVYWPTQYQNLYAEDNAFSQSVGTLPIGFGIIFGSLMATLLLGILKGKIRVLMIVNTIVMTAANGAMACATPDNLNSLWPVVTIACIGVGTTIVPLQVVAGIICPPDLIGTITAATIAVRVIGGSIAYAAYYNVFVSKFRSVVPTVIAPVAQSIGITSAAEISEIALFLQGGGFARLADLPGITTQAQVDALTRAGKEALARSFPQVYYISIAFGGCAIIASFFLTGVDKVMREREMEGTSVVEEQEQAQESGR